MTLTYTDVATMTFQPSLVSRTTTSVFDQRWSGTHGIGRFASELRKQMDGFNDLPMTGSPLGNLDSVQLSRTLSRMGATLYFSPGFNVPIASKCEVVATIHDLIHLRFSDEKQLAKLAYYRLLQRPVVRASRLIATVSHYSKSEIVQWYGVDPDNVVVLGNAASDRFVVQGTAHDLGGPYFLTVSNSKPHKNLHRLIDAFALISDTIEHQLVIVARPSDAIVKQVARLQLDGRVTFEESVTDEKLASMYRGAACLVYPSLYEGFGLPAIEAMACGCPILSSNRTSLPEVIGEAAEYFDPKNTQQIAEVMLAAARGQLPLTRYRRAGLERASQYRWSAIARCLDQAITSRYSVPSLISSTESSTEVRRSA